MTICLYQNFLVSFNILFKLTAKNEPKTIRAIILGIYIQRSKLAQVRWTATGKSRVGPVNFSMTLVRMSGRNSIKHYRYISKMIRVLSLKPLSRKMYFSCC